MDTIKGVLALGLCDDNGVWHRDFEMRLATLADVEHAWEETPETAGPPRLNRHVWARCLVGLGTLPPERITAALLARLDANEYGILQEAQEKLRKKRIAASAGSAASASPPPLSSSKASSSPTSGA